MGDVLGWIWFLVPLGVGVIALREYKLAKTCFTISGLLLAGKIVMEVHRSGLPIGWRFPIVFVACGVIGLGVYGSYIWTNHKHEDETRAAGLGNPDDVKITDKIAATKIPAPAIKTEVHRSHKQQDQLLQQKREELCVRLSRQRTERSQVYGSLLYAELAFLTADAQANDKHFSQSTRKQLATTVELRLKEFNEARKNAVQPHDNQFSETIARVRLAFPQTPEFSRLLADAEWRPHWDLDEPHCPDTLDMKCMAVWAHTQSDKGNAALEESKNRINALLAYMNANITQQ